MIVIIGQGLLELLDRTFSIAFKIENPVTSVLDWQFSSDISLEHPFSMASPW